ncbi:hypothetical protein ACQY0O_001154 [Thecaphora frezii]
MACCTTPVRSCLVPKASSSHCSAPPPPPPHPSHPHSPADPSPSTVRLDQDDTEKEEDHDVPSSTFTPTLTAAPLSLRGASHASKHTSFWETFDALLSHPYCAATNPSGFINLGIANNSLMASELLVYFHNHLALLPVDLSYGTSLYGSTRLFAALCHYFNTSSDFQPVTPVLPHHIVTGPGAGPMLDQVFEHLTDAGEGVLCAAPYYNGFDADLATRSRVRCVPVFSPDGDGTEAASFEGASALCGFHQAYTASCDNGVEIRAILVCNPHNPVGRCYDRTALIEYGRFAAGRNLHLVFDEIYASSVFPTQDEPLPQPFISALAIDWRAEAGLHPANVHVVSSASKDWGLNGFRIGMLVSQHNPALISAVKSTAKLYMVSSPADALFSHLLTDDGFCRPFIALNRARLSSAYALARAWCRHHAIRYVPSNAGHFVLIDLSSHLVDNAESPGHAEAALWHRILERQVCVTPASNYHHPKPGVFRLTFSLKRDEMLEGLKRLESALGLDPWEPPQ